MQRYELNMCQLGAAERRFEWIILQYLQEFLFFLFLKSIIVSSHPWKPCHCGEDFTCLVGPPIYASCQQEIALVLMPFMAGSHLVNACSNIALPRICLSAAGSLEVLLPLPGGAATSAQCPVQAFLMKLCLTSGCVCCSSCIEQ